MAIRDLAAHSANFVTVAELADYWAVSRQQVYKRIESGALEAIRLGARLYRVRTRAALEFERRASVTNLNNIDDLVPSSPPPDDRLPAKVGFRRIARTPVRE
jgi:excisionase family DNA binding protein